VPELPLPTGHCQPITGVAHPPLSFLIKRANCTLKHTAIMSGVSPGPTGPDRDSGTAYAGGPDGYRACPGATTMQGCWLAASRAQAAFAALVDRLLRRARYKTLPPKAEVGKSSI
jgi:hypothetical protein